VTDTKSTNPKDAIGCDKLPVHLWPETATLMGCVALANGALKVRPLELAPRWGAREHLY
jgi:hypothetical protein